MSGMCVMVGFNVDMVNFQCSVGTDFQNEM
jgi:hypothetical protein